VGRLHKLISKILKFFAALLILKFPT